MVAFASVLFVLGGLLLWLGASSLAALVGRLAAPRYRPGTLVPGPATVVGTVHPLGEPLEAPLSGARCSWWAFSVEERRRARSGWIWYVVAQGATSRAALLRDQDGAGAVRVELRDARVSAGPGVTVPAGEAGSLTLARLRRLAAGTAEAGDHEPTDDATPRAVMLPPRSRHGELDPNTPLTTAPGAWRIIETHLPLGAEVWASGTAHQPAAAPGLDLAGTAGRPVVVSTGGMRQGVSTLIRRAAAGWLLGLTAWFGAVAAIDPTVVQVLLSVLPPAVLALGPARAFHSTRRSTRDSTRDSTRPVTRRGTGDDRAGQRKATGV